MSKHLNKREQLIIRNSWIVTRDEKDKLDHFFLIRDTWENLEPDFTVDEVELKRYLRHEGKEYEVILMQPVRVLKVARELGLSFRVHRATDTRVVLINEWISEGVTANGV